MRGARSQKSVIDGHQFDSIAEACFYCWCKEAKKLGVIKAFELQPHYDLTPTVTYSVEKQLKTKTKKITRTLLQASSYTADFYVYSNYELGGLLMPTEWVEEGQPKFHSFGYIVDVKGAFNKAASEFSLLQKMMWNIRNRYVNKVVVAYDTKKYSPKKCQSGFFAMNGVPEHLPSECYQKNGVDLYAVWSRMFNELPSIKEVYD